MNYEEYRMMEEKWIEVLQENTKLKAEIEQWQSTNLKLTCELTRVECENHQLKAELEQSVKMQNILSKLAYGSEFVRCYMCDNNMKNITLDGKNNGCNGRCYHKKNYTESDLIEKIKRELDRLKGKVEE